MATQTGRPGAAGSHAHGGVCNVSATDAMCLQQIDKLADAVLEKYGCIDVLVNVAGVYPDNVSLLEGPW